MAEMGEGRRTLTVEEATEILGIGQSPCVSDAMPALKGTG